MFYGRERERKDLERRYAGGKFECAVIYGRRRVGKTALISEFVKDKPVIFFTGAEGEEISKQYLWEEFGAGKGAVAFTDIGRWWGNDSRRRQESEIDIVGASEDGEALFAECKWTNEKADAATLNELAEKAAVFPRGKKAYYVFSKSGFTAGCEAAAEALGDTRLLSLRDMLRIRNHSRVGHRRTY
jgi:AAA+ ATPase superfamily predicted ATPase